MKRKLKEKKAPDRQGWRYEYVQWAGRDLERSIKLMINETRGAKLQSNEWHQMTIKSISKNLRKKMEIQYKRGLFLSNIISKCIERIFLNRRQDVIEMQYKRGLFLSNIISKCTERIFLNRRQDVIEASVNQCSLEE